MDYASLRSNLCCTDMHGCNDCENWDSTSITIEGNNNKYEGENLQADLRYLFQQFFALLQVTPVS